MKDLYAMVGISKQAHYKRAARLRERLSLEEVILNRALEIRTHHKRIGCRKLYGEINPQGYGRDRTERLLLDNGFRLPKKRRYTRTTYSGSHHFENHISGMRITGTDQLWVSDITYVPVGYKSHYYLTLVQDVYSRLVVGWSLSGSLSADSTVLVAYKMAIGRRSGKLKGLVFHSDRGGQYYSKEVRLIHEAHQVLPSMGNKAWENAHAESLNGVLKNEYIELATGTSLAEAKKQVSKWIKLYNEDRPHGSIKNRKPLKYETFLQGLALEERPIVKINY